MQFNAVKTHWMPGEIAFFAEEFFHIPRFDERFPTP